MHQHIQSERVVGCWFVGEESGRSWLESACAYQDFIGSGSRVVTKCLETAGLLPYLEKLGFGVTAYGCTTCIGNAGDLTPAMNEPSLRTISLLRQFCLVTVTSKRVFTRTSAPTSWPLLHWWLLYAIAGNVTKDLMTEPVGRVKAKTSTWATSGLLSAEINKLMKFAMNSKLSKITTLM